MAVDNFSRLTNIYKPSGNHGSISVHHINFQIFRIEKLTSYFAFQHTVIIIVYYATKAANIHSCTYKNTIKNNIKLKKNIKILNIQNALMHRQVQVIRS